MERTRYLTVSQRRLERLRGRLQRASQGMTRWRLACFGVGLLGLLALSEAQLWLLTWLWLGLSSLAFAVLVGRHQGIRRQQRRVDHALLLKRAHRARWELDWSAIPSLPAEDPIPGHPFERDLDLTGPESLYRLLHTCLTVEGGARLKSWLLALRPDPDAVQLRQARVAALRNQHVLRDQIQLAVGEAAADWRQPASQQAPWQSAEILDLLPASSGKPLGKVLAGLSALAALTGLLWGGHQLQLLPAWHWQLSLAVYVLIYWLLRQRLGSLFKESHGLQYGLFRLSGVFALLEQRSPTRPAALQDLLRDFSGSERPSRLLKRLNRVVAGASLQGNPLLWAGVNLVLPWDVWFAWRLEQLRPRLAAQLPRWLDTLWELESLCALAHFAWLHPEAPFPEMGTSELEVVGLGHPLLPRSALVRNDFALPGLGEAFLITGSNMAGKSTFLKGLGVNLVLAQAGSVVDATRFAAPWMRPFACIRVSDSVVDGLSYFYAEVQRHKALLDALNADDTYPLFFVVDEIFRGTNNRERLMGSQAYLQALTGRPGLGGVSTHDLELVQVADQHPQLRNLHFRETIADGRMHFDYTLRQGPCPTTNALRIMHLAGLPVPASALQDP
ncbi:MAG: MutS-related protein [Candidatus Sericytochromatia bacterium]